MSAMEEFQPGEQVQVAVAGNSHFGRVGHTHRLSASGKSAAADLGNTRPTMRVMSLERISEWVWMTKDAVAELAEELTRLVRLVLRGLEALARCRDGSPEARK
jgi:hypothetical protein